MRNLKEEFVYDGVRLALGLKIRNAGILRVSVDQLAQILHSTTIAFYLAMSFPLNTPQDEAEAASVPRENDQESESMYVDEFRDISQH